MPANPPNPLPTKRPRHPIIAQREARARMALENAPKGSGQVIPPAPPKTSDDGIPLVVNLQKVSKAREALETLPDSELIEKAEVLLPEYEKDWGRRKLIYELLKAGVAS